MTIWAVGVDVGGTKIACAAVNEKGEIFCKERQKTDVDGGADAIVLQIAEGVKNVIEQVGSNPKGVGIAIAGQVNKEDGSVLFSPNLQWNNVPIKEKLQEKLSFSVSVLNDVRAAGYGEWHFGAGKGCDDQVLIFVGTGIGGSIISGGRMLIGNSNTAGEIGHLVICSGGLQCTCGNRGCFEAYAGGWGIAKRAQAMFEKYPSDPLIKKAGGLKKITARHIFDARASHLIAKELFDQTAKYLIDGCTSLVNILGPKKLILGGGIIEGAPELIELISAGIKKQALKAASNNLEVHLSCLMPDSPIIGTATSMLGDWY